MIRQFTAILLVSLLSTTVRASDHPQNSPVPGLERLIAAGGELKGTARAGMLAVGRTHPCTLDVFALDTTEGRVYELDLKVEDGSATPTHISGVFISPDQATRSTATRLVLFRLNDRYLMHRSSSWQFSFNPKGDIVRLTAQATMMVLGARLPDSRASATFNPGQR